MKQVMADVCAVPALFVAAAQSGRAAGKAGAFSSTTTSLVATHTHTYIYLKSVDVPAYPKSAYSATNEAIEILCIDDSVHEFL